MSDNSLIALVRITGDNLIKKNWQNQNTILIKFINPNIHKMPDTKQRII